MQTSLAISRFSSRTYARLGRQRMTTSRHAGVQLLTSRTSFLMDNNRDTINVSGHRQYTTMLLHTTPFMSLVGQRHHSLTQVRTKVFVSRHNTMQVSEKQIIDQCANHGISSNETRTTRTHVILKECPFCENPTNNKADNHYKLYVSIGGGAYFCHRCGSKGSWYDFKMKLGGFEVVGIGDQSAPEATSSSSTSMPRADGRRTTHSNITAPLPMPSERLAACYISSLVDQPETNQVLDYLINVRGLLKTTLRKYGVGRATYNFPSKEPNSQNKYVAAECVTFPWIMRTSQVKEQEALRGADYNPEPKQKKPEPKQDNPEQKQDYPETKEDKGHYITRRIKARALQEKAWQRLDPPGGGWGLFGFHTVPEHATELVITEGEYDAMAVYQGTGRPAVSLPNGCRSLPVEVLPLLEQFEKIYLWMDNDGPGQEGAEKFAAKIGQKRCLLVKPDSTLPDMPKDANEALLMGLDMNEMLDKASLIPHERILQFGELRDDVLHEIMHPDKYVGVPVTSLPRFTSLVKGFRRGEVTVLTGPTGSGKTTFLGQLSLDFAEQGVNTLWGSFEIKNTRLLHKLLQQFSREPLPVGKPEMLDSLNALADRFETLPLHFMKFHGGSDVDDVLDAMDFAAYVYDVEHVILDNMQFMISRNTSGGSKFDKFDVQDGAIEKFRKFATDRNVHVTLVVHPRKEDEGARLGISSIYGSAKATQEADLVLILQNEGLNDGKRKYIEVKKNRFDGELGNTPLFFERSSGRYVESPEADLSKQTRATPVPTRVQAGTTTIRARMPQAAASPSDSEIDNHWDSMLEGTDEK